MIEPGLRRQSLQNGNVRGCGRRLSPIGALRLPIWESGDERLTREKPAFAAHSRISWGARQNAGVAGWSERIRTHAFPIESGLCVRVLEFGNMAEF